MVRRKSRSSKGYLKLPQQQLGFSSSDLPVHSQKTKATQIAGNVLLVDSIKCNGLGSWKEIADLLAELMNVLCEKKILCLA